MTRVQARHIIRSASAVQLPSLRPANIGDVESFMRLKTALSAEAEHMIFDVANRAAFLHRTSEELTGASTGTRGIFVLEWEGALVGYIDVHSAIGDTDSDFASFSLALLKDWWGCGLGSRLVLVGEEWARIQRFRFLVILVAVLNERAFSLYRKLGYTVCADLRAAEAVENGVGDHLTLGRMIISNQNARPLPGDDRRSHPTKSELPEWRYRASAC